MKTNLPIPHSTASDVRDNLLEAMKTDGIKILPFMDKAKLSLVARNEIRNAQHHGAFIGDEILKRLDLGKPSFTRANGFKADHGVVEITTDAPLLLHFKRIGKKDALEAMMFVRSNGTWLATPTMHISATANNVLLDCKGRNPTDQHTRLVQYYSELTAHTLLVLGHHLRTRD
jgi:hypothetical protein